MRLAASRRPRREWRMHSPTLASFDLSEENREDPSREGKSGGVHDNSS